MLDFILNIIVSQINNFTGVDISNYKEYLAIPGLASLVAFYFLYRGVMFVLKIIFYILLACVLVFLAAKYFNLV